MAFNYTNNTGVGAMFVYADSITSNHLGTMTVITLSLIIFVILKGFTVDRAFIAASWTTAVLGGMLAINGIVNPSVPIAYIVLTVVGLFWTWNEANTK